MGCPEASRDAEPRNCGRGRRKSFYAASSTECYGAIFGARSSLVGLFSAHASGDFFWRRELSRHARERAHVRCASIPKLDRATCHKLGETMADSTDSSDADLPLDPRRQRAIQLLAKALHKEPGGDGPPSRATAGAAAAEEASFLRSLLALRSAREVHRLVHDRLSVLSVRSGEVEVHASAPRRRPRPAPPADHDGDPAAAPAAAPARDIRAALEAVQSGDLREIAPRALLQEFWRAECAYAETSPAAAHHDPSGPSPVPDDALAAASEDIRARGYACIEPDSATCTSGGATCTSGGATCTSGGATCTSGGWAWGGCEATLRRLEAAARALASRGWPPLFLFMLDEAWEARATLLARPTSL